MKYIFTTTIGMFLLAGVTVPAHAAVLSLSPASGTAKVGDTLMVAILINTEGKAVDGVDINALHYDPDVLSVIDADPETPGVQIAAGDRLPTTMVNNVDTEAGMIVFSQITNSGERYTSNNAEILATITFNVLKADTTRLSFDFEENRTDDSNVAAAGVDVLTGVADGTYTFSGEQKAGYWTRFIHWVSSWF